MSVSELATMRLCEGMYAFHEIKLELAVHRKRQRRFPKD